jgi:GNAT superfamily N-acetyltransferase
MTVIIFDSPKKINDINKIIGKIDKINTFIVDSVWNDLPDFKKIHNKLLKLGFEIFYKKIVFYKKIEKPKKSNMSFKTNLLSIMYKNYTDFIKNSKAPDFQLDKKNIKKSFNEILSNEKDWNFIALNKNNKCVGLLILEAYNDYYTTNLILINKEFQGKGYSYELLKKAEEEFYKKRDRKYWYESTWEGDKPMINAFKKYGFKNKRKMYFYIKNLM